MPNRLHADEPDIDAALVARLLAAQCPAWARLPIVTVETRGTSNAMFRLGAQRVVRLPRTGSAALQVVKEQRWLPILAPHLPLRVPDPLFLGAAGEGYPWPWSVLRWIPGETANPSRITDSAAAARALAAFLQALRALPATGAPSPGAHNSGRGAPLRTRDGAFRLALAELGGAIDGTAAVRAWQAACDAPKHAGPSAWLHGDLIDGNMLVRDGVLSAIIDFGCLAAGDPACDLMAAWSWLPASARGVFRCAIDADEAAWARGRGWALSFGVIALPYYERRDPHLAAIARRTIDAVLADA